MAGIQKGIGEVEDNFFGLLIFSGLMPLDDPAECKEIMANVMGGLQFGNAVQEDSRWRRLCRIVGTCRPGIVSVVFGRYVIIGDLRSGVYLRGGR